MTLQIEQLYAGVKRHVITLEEYEQMCVAGVFGPETQVELIRGEIVDMSPPGPRHEAIVARLHEVFSKHLTDEALIWPQGNAIRLPRSHSRPQPDLSILRRREDYYVGKRPTAEDVVLLVEVSESTIRYDQGSKLALYAEAAIPEYWVVNVVKGVIAAYTNPSEGEYQSVRVAHRGELLQLPDPLEGSIAVTELIGKE